MPTCTNTICFNKATYNIMFKYSSILHKLPGQARTNLYTCNHCKELVHIEDVLSKQIIQIFMEFIAEHDDILDPCSYKLVFLPLDYENLNS